MATSVDPAIAKRVREAGMRMSEAKFLIINILAKEEKPLTITEIIAKCSENTHFVSIYRSIDNLVKANVIKQVPIGFKNKYELSDDFRPHHHHVTCENCGKSVSIQSEEIENALKEITLRVGYKPTKHHFEAYGLCDDCC